MHLFRKVKLRTTPVLFIMLGLALLFPISSYSAGKTKFIVVIDAGHGGKDSGAVENQVAEKDVNLAVALKLGNLIKKNLKNTEVIYTRETDKFVSLQGRANIANKAQADLFISIHCNSVDRNNPNRSNVQGATTYVLGHHKDEDNMAVARRENNVAELDANDKLQYAKFDETKVESVIISEMSQKQNFRNSVRFAKDVQNGMQQVGRLSRGVQQAGFWVLWSTAMPSALIELDFLCNPAQAKFLASEEGQDKLAKAIYEGVRKYEMYFRQNLGTLKAAKEVAMEELKNSGKTPAKKTEEQPVLIAEVEEQEVVEPEVQPVAEQPQPSNVPEEAENVVVQNNPESSSVGNRTSRRHKASPSGQETPASGNAGMQQTAESNSNGSTGGRASRRHKVRESQVEQAVIPFEEESSTNENSGDLAMNDSSASTGESSATAPQKKLTKQEEKEFKKKDKEEKKRQEEEAKKLAKENKNKKGGKSQQPAVAATEEKGVQDSGNENLGGGRKAASKRRSQKQQITTKYTILLTTSEKKLGDKTFKDLQGVKSYREDNLFKYTVGESENREDMQKMLKEVIKDFPEAVIIEIIS